MKPPRGYVLVNLDKCDSEKIRALAQCHWSGVQGALRDAVFNKMRDLERELGISAEQAVTMSKTKRAAFRLQHGKLRPQLVGYNEGPQLSVVTTDRWLLPLNAVPLNRLNLP